MTGTFVWLWHEDDRHATERMRRALLMPYGAVLLLVAALVAATEPPATGAISSLNPPLPTVLACVVVGVGVCSLLGRFGWVQLAALTVTIPAALWVRDPTRAELHLPAIMLEVLVLVGIGINLRRVPAAIAGTLLTLAFTGLAAWRDPGPGWAWWDLAVINSGVLAACAAFMATLISTARETDRLAAEADALETRTRLESTRSSSAHRARGLAHNNAVYALEAISTGPGIRRPRQRTRFPWVRFRPSRWAQPRLTDSVRQSSCRCAGRRRSSAGWGECRRTGAAPPG